MSNNESPVSEERQKTVKVPRNRYLCLVEIASKVVGSHIEAFAERAPAVESCLKASVATLKPDAYDNITWG